MYAHTLIQNIIYTGIFSSICTHVHIVHALTHIYHAYICMVIHQMESVIVKCMLYHCDYHHSRH